MSRLPLRISNPDGSFIVEQQAYLAERNGRIGWMRVLCSGVRPLESLPEPARIAKAELGKGNLV